MESSAFLAGHTHIWQFEIWHLWQVMDLGLSFLVYIKPSRIHSYFKNLEGFNFASPRRYRIMHHQLRDLAKKSEVMRREFISCPFAFHFRVNLCMRGRTGISLSISAWKHWEIDTNLFNVVYREQQLPRMPSRTGRTLLFVVLVPYFYSIWWRGISGEWMGAFLLDVQFVGYYFRRTIMDTACVSWELIWHPCYDIYIPCFLSMQISMEFNRWIARKSIFFFSITSIRCISNWRTDFYTLAGCFTSSNSVKWTLVQVGYNDFLRFEHPFHRARVYYSDFLYIIFWIFRKIKEFAYLKIYSLIFQYFYDFKIYRV